jgi:hypothetical protein
MKEILFQNQLVSSNQNNLNNSTNFKDSFLPCNIVNKLSKFAIPNKGYDNNSNGEIFPINSYYRKDSSFHINKHSSLSVSNSHNSTQYHVSEKKKQNSKIEIDLTGPDGNAFVLIGKASNLAKQLGLDQKAIQAEMMSGDYENLVKVFDNHFGSFVTLYR